MASNLTVVGITARDTCQHSDGPRQYSAVLSSGIDCFDPQKSHFSSPPISPVVDTNHLNQQNQVTYMMCTGHLLYCTRHLCSPRAAGVSNWYPCLHVQPVTVCLQPWPP
mmetsp:Transcript_32501/g.52872  ORF Transcript_32501/g.52872 Transcript_32501/m.52872 type:complete len:109 (+) Transcript_32501:191-517(+)